jgi:hypothetical protein
VTGLVAQKVRDSNGLRAAKSDQLPFLSSSAHIPRHPSRRVSDVVYANFGDDGKSMPETQQAKAHPLSFPCIFRSG